MPAADKAAAARSEKSKTPRPKSFTWKGIKMELPAQLPGDLAFEMADAEASHAQVSPSFTFLRAIVGDEVYGEIRAKVTEEKIPYQEVSEVLEEILSSVLNKYGLGSGESEASQDS